MKMCGGSEIFQALRGNPCEQKLEWGYNPGTCEKPIAECRGQYCFVVVITMEYSSTMFHTNQPATHLGKRPTVWSLTDSIYSLGEDPCTVILVKKMTSSIVMLLFKSEWSNLYWVACLCQTFSHTVLISYLQKQKTKPRGSQRCNELLLQSQNLNPILVILVLSCYSPLP